MRGSKRRAGLAISIAACLGLGVGLAVTSSTAHADATVYTVESSTVTVDNGYTGDGVASCASGDVVTGGGWTTSYGDWTVLLNYPYLGRSPGAGWEVDMENNSGSTQTYYAWAVCESGS